jgi:hypothetical protein
MLLGEVVVVGAAAATLAGPGVGAALSLVGAAADVAVRAARESAREGRRAGEGIGIAEREGRQRQSERKRERRDNGKSFSVRLYAHPTANPWFNNLQANSRKREESHKKKRQAENEEKERENAANFKAAVDLLGGGKKRKKNADISPASAAATAVEAPILAGHPPEVTSLRKKQKISQSVKEKNDEM